MIICSLSHSIRVALTLVVATVLPAFANADEACVEELLQNSAFHDRYDGDAYDIEGLIAQNSLQLQAKDSSKLCAYLSSIDARAVFQLAGLKQFKILDIAEKTYSSAIKNPDATELNSHKNIELANSLARYQTTEYYLRMIEAGEDKKPYSALDYSSDISIEFYRQQTLSDKLGLATFLTSYELVSSISVAFRQSDQFEAWVFFPFTSVYFNKNFLRADPTLIASKVSPDIKGLLEPLDGYRLLRITPGTDICAAKLSYILDEDERERVKIVFDYARSLAQAKRRKDRTDFDNALKAFVPECT